MIVVLANEQLDRPVGGAQGSGEIACLALELRRLLAAVRQHDRRREELEMALRTELLLDLVGEAHIARARREPHRLEVVHAAAQQSCLDDIGRQPEPPCPVRHHRDACQMGAGGMAIQMDTVRVAAEARGVAMHPGDGAAHLIDHRSEIAARGFHVDEVRHDVMYAGIARTFRQQSQSDRLPRSAIRRHASIWRSVRAWQRRDKDRALPPASDRRRCGAARPADRGQGRCCWR